MEFETIEEQEISRETGNYGTKVVVRGQFQLCRFEGHVHGVVRSGMKLIEKRRLRTQPCRSAQ